MSEQWLDKLGDYFVHFEIARRYGITFEKFIRLVEAGGGNLFYETNSQK